jgi:serine protease Do
VARGVQLAVGIAAGALLGLAAARWWPARAPETPGVSPPTPGALAPAPVPGEAPAWQTHFAQLAKRAAPGVVNVHTSRTLSRTLQPGFPFPGFERFFGVPAPGAAPEEERFTVPSLGSGFVISADGLIVTNHHVVDGVDRITVSFSDGREAEATVVGQDPLTDIALIRVSDLEGLTPLELGDSDAVQPGDWVVAIGNPFGLGHTVTAGIVSAKGREIGAGPYDDFIQTDAAINPGNSGGPLLDLQGRVVGINTAINPRANTIGFAVPINIAKQILPQLESAGRVTRGWLGASVQRITPELAEAMKLASRAGAVVTMVVPGGPAAKAGLRSGDVIVGFAGKPLADVAELPRAVAAAAPGTRLPLEVLREGERVTLEVEIGELSAPGAAPRRAEAPGGARDLGLRVQDLSPELRERLGVVESGGVLVEAVEPGSPADVAGLAPGDVVLEVDQATVSDAADLDARLRAAGGRVLFLVQRGPDVFFAVLKR